MTETSMYCVVKVHANQLATSLKTYFSLRSKFCLVHEFNRWPFKAALVDIIIQTVDQMNI